MGTLAESQAAWQDVEQDLASGSLATKPNLWGPLIREGEPLAEHHAPVIGSRSLDVLHVAAALVLHETDFPTRDSRQARLAQLAGLHVQP
jgi:hypothetical protein